MISISFIVKRLVVPILFSVFAPPVSSQTQPCAKLSYYRTFITTCQKLMQLKTLFLSLSLSRNLQFRLYSKIQMKIIIGNFARY